MSRDLLAYGITTQVFAGGASVISQINGTSPYVLTRLLYSNSTLASMAGNTSSFPNVPIPYPFGVLINGPAPIAVAGATVFCITSLSQGFNVTLGY